jgi:hypothetical protein
MGVGLFQQEHNTSRRPQEGTVAPPQASGSIYLNEGGRMGTAHSMEGNWLYNSDPSRRPQERPAAPPQVSGSIYLSEGGRTETAHSMGGNRLFNSDPSFGRLGDVKGNRLFYSDPSFGRLGVGEERRRGGSHHGGGGGGEPQRQFSSLAHQGNNGMHRPQGQSFAPPQLMDSGMHRPQGPSFSPSLDRGRVSDLSDGSSTLSYNTCYANPQGMYNPREMYIPSITRSLWTVSESFCRPIFEKCVPINIFNSFIIFKSTIY